MPPRSVLLEREYESFSTHSRVKNPPLQTATLTAIMRARLGLPIAITALIILKVPGAGTRSDLTQKHAEVLQVH